MNRKKLPLSKEQIEEIIERFETPFYLYDEKGIRDNAKRLNKAFAWNKGFKEYYAIKAAPNPYILKILKEEGFGGDCSSYPEMILCEKVGDNWGRRYIYLKRHSGLRIRKSKRTRCHY